MARIISHYLETVIDPKKLPQTIKRMVKELKPYADRFDAIAFTGMSGTLVAPAVALKLKKSFLMVRKTEKLGSHSAYTVEGDMSTQRYLILDDQISTGTTVIDILKKISECESFDKPPKCVGVALYNDSSEYHDSTSWGKGKINDLFGIDSHPVVVTFK